MVFTGHLQKFDQRDLNDLCQELLRPWSDSVQLIEFTRELVESEAFDGFRFVLAANAVETLFWRGEREQSRRLADRLLRQYDRSADETREQRMLQYSDSLIITAAIAGDFERVGLMLRAEPMSHIAGLTGQIGRAHV